jgi:hypothetical protein
MDRKSQEAKTYTTRNMRLRDHGARFRDNAWEGGCDARTHPEGFFDDRCLFICIRKFIPHMASPTHQVRQLLELLPSRRSPIKTRPRLNKFRLQPLIYASGFLLQDIETPVHESHPRCVRAAKHERLALLIQTPLAGLGVCPICLRSQELVVDRGVVRQFFQLGWVGSEVFDLGFEEL